MKLNFLLLAAGVAALSITACDRASDPTGPAHIARPASDVLADHTNEQDIPWSSEQQDPCTGDNVVITGTTHFLITTVANSGGTFHLTSRANSTGTGIGVPSGIQYAVKDNFSYMEQDAIPSSTVRQEWDIQVMGPKSTDNYLYHMVFKLTINALGVPTAEFEKASTKCVG